MDGAAHAEDPKSLKDELLMDGWTPSSFTYSVNKLSEVLFRSAVGPLHQCLLGCGLAATLILGLGNVRCIREKGNDHQ